MRPIRPQLPQPDCRTLMVLAWVCLAVCLPTSQMRFAAAQQPGSSVVDRSHKIKAAFVYNFGRYVQWPTVAFAHRQSPFVVGVLGPSPITADLRDIAQTKTVQDRPILVRQLSGPEGVPGCQILFVSKDVEPQIRDTVVEQCSGIAILLVGETEDFLDQGGMVGLVVKENKVRVHIDLTTAEGAGLQISSKLLQVSEIANSDNRPSREARNERLSFRVQ